MRKLLFLAVVVTAIGALAVPATGSTAKATISVKSNDLDVLRTSARDAAEEACTKRRSASNAKVTVKHASVKLSYSTSCDDVAPAPTTTTTTLGPYTPVPTDFAINVIVLEQSCFGSAGCNVTYRIDVAYVGARTPDPSATFEVVYNVLGGDDLKIGRFELQGSRLSFASEERIGTPSDPVLTAVATTVLKS